MLHQLDMTGQNCFQDPTQALPWAWRREVSGSGVGGYSSMSPQNQDVEPKLQEAPLSLSIWHSWCGGWGRDLDLGQKGKREVGKEQIRSPKAQHLTFRVWSSWHSGLLQAPYLVSFRWRNGGICLCWEERKFFMLHFKLQGQFIIKREKYMAQ